MASKVGKDDEGHRIKSPGLMLNLSDKCSNIFPALFDGFRLYIHKGLSSHFIVSHSIALSSITPGNYRFGASYVGNKIISAHEGVPVLYGDIDCRGRTNASLYHTLFGSKLRVRFDSQIENGSFVRSQFATHYMGDTYTASAIFANTDILANSGSMILHYLQSVTPNLALGAELLYLHNVRDVEHPALIVPDSKFSRVSVAGRYTTPHSVWSTTLSLNNVFVGFYNKASDQLEFGVELNTNFMMKESVGAFAYQITLKDRGIVLRGYIDSNTNVGSVFEKRFCGTPYALSLSGNLNFNSSNFRLGLGLTIE